MSNITTRSGTDLQKIEELIDRKLESLASKESINELNELKYLFEQLNNKIEKQNSEIFLLNKRMDDQDTKISQLEDKIAVLTASNAALKAQSDNQEQYSRRQCLRIKGIDKTEDESSSACVDKVIKVCRKLKVNVDKPDIDRAHRIGKDRSTMIVKFHSFSKRTELYKARNKQENPGLKIHLDITKDRLTLLDKARSLITKDCSVDFVFADINCNTVAKLKNDNFKFFKDIDTFESLL